MGFRLQGEKIKEDEVEEHCMSMRKSTAEVDKGEGESDGKERGKKNGEVFHVVLESANNIGSLCRT